MDAAAGASGPGVFLQTRRRRRRRRRVDPAIGETSGVPLRTLPDRRDFRIRAGETSARARIRSSRAGDASV